MKKKILFILMLFASLTLVACGDKTEPEKPVNPEKIEFTMTETSVKVGSYELKAKVLPEKANQDIRYVIVGLQTGISIDRNTLYVSEAAIDGSKFSVSASSTFDPTIKAVKEFTVDNKSKPVEKTEIKTEEELRNISLTGNYILMNDIKLTEKWEPIGIAEEELDDGTIVEGEYFNGKFDGGGFTISDIDIVGTFNAGFFAQIGALGVVENTAFEGKIEASGWTGGIAGINVGLIQNVVSNVKVNVRGTSAGSIVSVNRGVIQYAYGIGKVSSETNNNTMGRSAGLVVANDGTMTEVYGDMDTLETPNFVAFQPTTNPNYMLPTADMKLKATFEAFDEDVWYLADGTYPLLKHEGFVPPVLGDELLLTITNQTLEFDLEETTEVQVTIDLVNGKGQEVIVYELETEVVGVSIGATGLITFDLTEIAASSKVVVVAQVDGTEVKAKKEFTFIYNPVPADDVVEITTAKELMDLLSGQKNPEILSKNFVLKNNIVLDENWVSVGLAPNEDEGVIGIPFTGEFNGNGYEISGIVMPGGGYNKAFFGLLGEDAIVRNTKFTGNLEASAWSGALVAQNNGLVKDVIVNINVYVYGGNGGALIEHNNGTVENVIVTGKIVSDNGPTSVGLFVTNSSSGVIKNVFAQESTLKTDILIKVGDVKDPERNHILTDEQFLNENTYSEFSSEHWTIVNGEVPSLKQK